MSRVALGGPEPPANLHSLDLELVHIISETLCIVTVDENDGHVEHHKPTVFAKPVWSADTRIEWLWFNSTGQHKETTDNVVPTPASAPTRNRQAGHQTVAWQSRGHAYVIGDVRVAIGDVARSFFVSLPYQYLPLENDEAAQDVFKFWALLETHVFSVKREESNRRHAAANKRTTELRVAGLKEEAKAVREALAAYNKLPRNVDPSVVATYARMYEFLKDKTVLTTTVSGLTLYIENASSVYMTSGNDLLHVSPDNVLRNPARSKDCLRQYVVFYK
jgi:hypothetical protein